MAKGRWYPTVTALADGQMLVTAGQVDGCGQNKRPERWQGSNWVQLGSSAERELPYYP